MGDSIFSLTMVMPVTSADSLSEEETLNKASSKYTLNKIRVVRSSSDRVTVMQDISKRLLL